LPSAVLRSFLAVRPRERHLDSPISRADSPAFFISSRAAWEMPMAGGTTTWRRVSLDPSLMENSMARSTALSETGDPSIGTSMFLKIRDHLPRPRDSLVNLMDSSGLSVSFVIALMASMSSGTTIDSW